MIGHDEDGEPITVATVRPVDAVNFDGDYGGAQKAPAKLPKRAQDLLAIIEKSGNISITALRAAAKGLWGDLQDGAFRQAFHRAKLALVDGGIVVAEGDAVQLVQASQPLQASQNMTERDGNGRDTSRHTLPPTKGACDESNATEQAAADDTTLATKSEPIGKHTLH